jgi:hypothetical protein
MAGEPGQFRISSFARGGSGAIYRWNLTTDMGQELARSGDFPDLETAKKSIQWLKDNVGKCGTIEPEPWGPAIG